MITGIAAIAAVAALVAVGTFITVIAHMIRKDTGGKS